MSNIFSIGGFILCIVAAIFIILGFSTPYWMEPDSGRYSSARFDRLGLWEVCFRDYSDNRDGFGRIFTGCRWVFSREYETIRKWLLPGWFVITQALMTIALVAALLCALFGMVLLLGCIPEKMKKYVAIVVCLGNYLMGLLVGISLIYFGTNAENDRTWLTQATYRHLSWSFYVSMVGGLVALLAGMLYTVYFINIRKSGQNRTAYRAHELRHYRSERRQYY